MTTRIVTGIGLLALLFVALYFGGWVFALLWVAAVCLAMYEEFHALSKTGLRPVAIPSWIALIIAVPGFLLMTEMTGILLLMLLTMFTMMTVSLVVIFRSNPKLEDLLMSLLPLFSIVLPGLCMLALVRVTPMAQQRIFLSLAFFVPVVGDSFAYFAGVRFGRVKLVPEVSPKKTVEGAAAGLVGSVVAAVVIYLVASALSSHGIPFYHFLLLGFFGGLIGQIGDLFASLVKRHCQIKDFGHIFPGHGGMMDRLDSILFVAVLVYLYQALL
ncbi:MAG: phosphatidate cytidylyltransferase [Clostridiales bacterium]|nr:phosphatidate cytidylyltransferase [Clostridiales bacterium]